MSERADPSSMTLTHRGTGDDSSEDMGDDVELLRRRGGAGGHGSSKADT